MKDIYKLAQNDGKSGSGNTVTNYTVKPSIPAQPMVPNKTPMHSRTQPETTSVRLPK